MKKLLFIALVVAVLTAYVASDQFKSPDVHTAIVERVIDGDTVALHSGERVRLLGINTPERGQKLWDEAKTALESMVLGKQIVLETDVEDKDKYGRLLRWVLIDDTLVNLEMVRLGFASTLFYQDTRYKAELLEAEAKAIESGIGIWETSKSVDLFCISVYDVQADAPGDDRANLAEEFVVLRNPCLKPFTMQSWRLEDERGARYVFPEFILSPKETVTLHTGMGQDNTTDLFWNLTSPVWNNDDDSILVWNTRGDLVLNYSY